MTAQIASTVSELLTPSRRFPTHPTWPQCRSKISLTFQSLNFNVTSFGSIVSSYRMLSPSIISNFSTSRPLQIIRLRQLQVTDCHRYIGPSPYCLSGKLVNPCCIFYVLVHTRPGSASVRLPLLCPSSLSSNELLLEFTFRCCFSFTPSLTFARR